MFLKLVKSQNPSIAWSRGLWIFDSRFVQYMFFLNSIALHSFLLNLFHHFCFLLLSPLLSTILLPLTFHCLILGRVPGIYQYVYVRCQPCWWTQWVSLIAYVVNMVIWGLAHGWEGVGEGNYTTDPTFILVTLLFLLTTNCKINCAKYFVN